MSAVFDQVNKALLALTKQENLTEPQRELLCAVGQVISDWHDLNHKQRDIINLHTKSELRVQLSMAVDKMLYPKFFQDPVE